MRRRFSRAYAASQVPVRSCSSERRQNAKTRRGDQTARYQPRPKFAARSHIERRLAGSAASALTKGRSSGAPMLFHSKARLGAPGMRPHLARADASVNSPTTGRKRSQTHSTRHLGGSCVAPWVYRACIRRGGRPGVCSYDENAHPCEIGQLGIARKMTSAVFAWHYSKLRRASSPSRQFYNSARPNKQSYNRNL